MIEGINLLISIFIGCIVFIYYTNALFKPRTKYLSQFQVLCKPSLWCRIEIH